jgi:Tfp pilus assembly protein PilX
VNRLFRRRDERGIALITAIMLSMVATMFVITTMYVAFHDQTSSAHNRSWGQALHVAESGVHQAIAYLQNSSGAVPSGTQTGTTTEGSYQYRIVAQSRNRYQIDAVGTVGNAGALQASRRLRVSMAPPVSFRYALFSLSDVTLKNNFTVCGDIYAGTNFEVDNNNSVLASTDSSCSTSSNVGTGSVTAATGYISMGNGTSIDGDAWSGGYTSGGVGISGGSIGGDAKASSSTPGCTDDASHSKYKISGGSVAGDATAWGAITSTVSGTKSANTCTLASESQAMPPFTFNSGNYSSVHTYNFNVASEYTAFNTYLNANKNSLSGTFYLTGGSSSTPVTLNGVTVSGDLTVVATGSPIEGGNGIDASGTSDKIVVLASWYTPSGGAASCAGNGGNPGDCAIGFKNNFSPDDVNTAVLLYAPNGGIAMKNNAAFSGAVYGLNVQFKNNMELDYDSRVQQIVGFGDSTLDITDWQECDPGSVTTSSCG